MSAATYYVVGPLTAQDGARVWTVVRQLEAAGRLVAVNEYMSEHAAIRAATEYNAAGAKAQALVQGAGAA